MTVVVKIGTSSLTKTDGSIKREAIAKLCDEVAEVREAYRDIILVSSGAIGVGLPALGITTNGLTIHAFFKLLLLLDSLNSWQYMGGTRAT